MNRGRLPRVSTGMHVSWRALAGPALGVLLLAVVLRQVGTGPVVRGLAAVDGWSLAAATAIGFGTTLCAAWRWRLVAAALGVRIPPSGAVAAYYRAQFLNTVLPGGVLGDVHRAATAGAAGTAGLAGTAHGDTARGARSVVWERLAGQSVQVVLTVAVLVVLPSPLRGALPRVVAAVALVAVAVVALGVIALAVGASARSSRLARMARTAAADVRAVLRPPGRGVRIVGASALVVAGHVATFLVAARAVGTPAGVDVLLPLAMLLLVVMSVPANIGGWGPREGAAAALFAAAGLGAGQGLAAATAYGVLALAATLPGAAVLLRDLVVGARAPVVARARQARL